MYPYEWMDSIDKMSETSLPSKANFYSTLTMEHISDEDYTHAQNVWGDISNSKYEKSIMTYT